MALICAITIAVSMTGFSSIASADATADYNLALTFYKQQKWQPAADVCKEFIDKYPNSELVPSAHLYWGQSLVHLQDFKAAREHFRKFTTLDAKHRDHALGMYRIGECSYFMGDYAAAEKELNAFVTAYEKNSLSEWARLYRAETLFRLNRTKDAVVAYEKYLADYPTGKLLDDAQYGLARSYEMDGNNDAALKLYAAVASRKNSTRAPDAQFNVGARFFDAGEYQKAIDAFTRVAKVFPTHSLAPLAEINTGYANYHLQKFDTAISHFNIASKSPDQHEAAQYWIGLCHKSKGEFAEAAKVFEAALKENGTQTLAENLMFQWGDAELRQKKYPRAIELFDLTLKNWPNGEFADDALHSACEAAFQSGDYAVAESKHNDFVSQFPTSPLRMVQTLLFARVIIADADTKTDAGEDQSARYRTAVDLLKQIVSNSKVPKTQLYAQFQLARSYERLDENAEVIQTCKIILENADKLTQEEKLDALLLTGNANLRAKQYKPAIEAYDELLKADGDGPLAVQARFGLVNAQLGTNDFESALTRLKELSDSDVEDDKFSQSCVAAGDAAFEAKKYPTAIAFFEMATAQGPESKFYTAALSGLGHAQYEHKDYPLAASSFAQLADIPSAEEQLRSHSTYMTALAYRQAEDTDNALKWYQQGVNTFSTDTDLQADDPNLEAVLNAYRCAKGGARVARGMKKNTEADQLYKLAFDQLKHLPKDEQGELDLLINEWADLSYNLEKFERSDELYRLLISERPESDLADDARLILAESLRFGKQTDAARTAFEDLAASPKADPFVKQRALIHLLDLAAETSEWEAALAVAERLSTDFPNNTHKMYVSYRKGEALLQSKSYEPAEELLTALKEEISADFEQAPKWWPEAWLLAGEALYRVKKYDELDEVLADLKAKAPDSPVLYRADSLQGQSYESRSRFEDAREAYRAVTDSPEGLRTETAAECQFRIAESYLKEKNYETAFKEYYKVYAGYDSKTYKPAALFQAGRCETSMKKWREAVQTFQTLVDEFPESEYAPQAEKEISEIVKSFPDLAKPKE